MKSIIKARSRLNTFIIVESKISLDFCYWEGSLINPSIHLRPSNLVQGPGVSPIGRTGKEWGALPSGHQSVEFTK